MVPEHAKDRGLTNPPNIGKETLDDEAASIVATRRHLFQHRSRPLSAEYLFELALFTCKAARPFGT